MNSIVAEVCSETLSLESVDFSTLWTYHIPELAPDGRSCSTGVQKDPFDLSQLLYSVPFDSPRVNRDLHLRQLRLQKIVNRVVEEELESVEWLGIYRRVNLDTSIVDAFGGYATGLEKFNPSFNSTFVDNMGVSRKGCACLVKEAYRGSLSRPIFPLTKSFASISNNSTVAMEGRSIVVKDTMAHTDDTGSYYECDARVRSEFCAPIFHKDEVIGIIDCESFIPDFFNEKRQGEILKICEDLGRLNLLL